MGLLYDRLVALERAKAASDVLGWHCAIRFGDGRLRPGRLGGIHRVGSVASSGRVLGAGFLGARGSLLASVPTTTSLYLGGQPERFGPRQDVLRTRACAADPAGCGARATILSSSIARSAEKCPAGRLRAPGREGRPEAPRPTRWPQAPQPAPNAPATKRLLCVSSFCSLLTSS